MAQTPHMNLSRRERQIMQIVYRRGRASAAEIMDEMPDAPSYSAVRATLRVLEEKNELKHGRDGRRYVYMPMTPRSRARSAAMRNLLSTFYDGSVEQAVASLLDLKSRKLSNDDLDRLSELIENARKEDD